MRCPARDLLCLSRCEEIQPRRRWKSCQAYKSSRLCVQLSLLLNHLAQLKLKRLSRTCKRALNPLPSLCSPLALFSSSLLHSLPHTLTTCPKLQKHRESRLDLPLKVRDFPLHSFGQALTRLMVQMEARSSLVRHTRSG